MQRIDRETGEKRVVAWCPNPHTLQVERERHQIGVPKPLTQPNRLNRRSRRFLVSAGREVPVAPAHQEVAALRAVRFVMFEQPLPPSQVVRPTPRGAEAYVPANVPALLPAPKLVPAAGDRITFSGGVLSIPE